MSKELTVEIAEQFLENPKAFDLSKFTSISDSAASVLAKYEGSLYLSGLISLSEIASEELGKYMGGYLSLNGLTFIPVNVSKGLAKCKGWISLSGLNSISEEIAEVLAKHESNLYLDGLNTISLEVAEVLVKHKGNLSLNGLTSLSDTIAESLAKHKNWISLNGLTELSHTAAAALATHTSGIYLDKLKTLTDKAAEALAKKNSGWINLKGLTSLSEFATQLFTQRKNFYFNDQITNTLKEFNESINLISKNQSFEIEKETFILKILNDSKEIMWDKQWDLNKYETLVNVDEHEFKIFAVSSTKGSEVWLYDCETKKEITSGNLFNLIEAFWECDTSTFEGEGRMGEVFLFDGVEIVPIKYYNSKNELVYNSDLDNIKFLEKLIQEDINILKYIDEFINQKKYLKGDLDLWQLTEIPEILLNVISKLRGELNLFSIEAITDNEALALSKHQGKLDLRELKNISETAAKLLSHHLGIVDLRGLESISDASIELILNSTSLFLYKNDLYTNYRKKYNSNVHYRKIAIDDESIYFEYISICPSAGICIDFTKNYDNSINIILDKQYSINYADFLQAIGFTLVEVLKLFNIPYIQIKNNRKDLEEVRGKKIVTKIFKFWKEDFEDEDTGEVFSMERSDLIYNIYEKISDSLIENVIELPIEYLYIIDSASDKREIILDTYLKALSATNSEAQKLLYRKLNSENWYDNDDVESIKKYIETYINGSAIDLGTGGRSSLNNLLNISEVRGNGFYKEDYIEIAKYLINH